MSKKETTTMYELEVAEIRIYSILVSGFMRDDDDALDYKENALKVAKSFKQPGRVYNYLMENRSEIYWAAHDEASQNIRSEELGEY